MGNEEEVPVEYPVDGVLDLHVFHPRDVKSVVKEYLRECRRAGILRVRIIHGKGRSVLRRIVHGVVEADPTVERFSVAAGDRSGWGATIVWMVPVAGDRSCGSD